jgi:uncharacterized membrane protein YhfC
VLRIVSSVCVVALAAYVVYVSAVSPRKYRRLLVPIVVHALIDLRVALFPPLAMEPLGSKR